MSNKGKLTHEEKVFLCTRIGNCGAVQGSLFRSTDRRRSRKLPENHIGMDVWTRIDTSKRLSL